MSNSLRKCFDYYAMSDAPPMQVKQSARCSRPTIRRRSGTLLALLRAPDPTALGLCRA
jgi:hypothetical protein